MSFGFSSIYHNRCNIHFIEWIGHKYEQTIFENCSRVSTTSREFSENCSCMLTLAKNRNTESLPHLQVTKTHSDAVWFVLLLRQVPVTWGCADTENSFDPYTSFLRNVITITTHFVILDLQDSIRRVFVFAPTAVRSEGRKKSSRAV